MYKGMVQNGHFDSNHLPIIIYTPTKSLVTAIVRYLTDKNKAAYRRRMVEFTAASSSLHKEGTIAAIQGENNIFVYVCTSAFGVGMNPPNIRAIFHYRIPDSFCDFYQEIGSIARDGLPGRQILLY
jgi:ATP-dependent DNA helicase RecQ